MDKKELLNSIIDSLISGDEAAAKSSFSDFATLKTSEIITPPKDDTTQSKTDGK